MAGTLHWIWLATLPGISARKAARLLDEIGDPLAIYNASEARLSAVSELTKADISALGDKSLQRADKIIHDTVRLGQQVITLADASYPELLRAIDDPPVVLYCRGKLQTLAARPAVAVVGPREQTNYGYRVTKNLVYQMARAGVTIVSGMARGTDAAAHAAALEAGMPTIAVLGCGLDICYPHENAALYEDIPKTGVIISEYPPGTPPIGSNFPARNRIVSGISCAVLLPEAPKKSGSLITAACAADQGREVFAVPGNIDTDSSAGTNALIRDGAHPVTAIDDILSVLADQYPARIREPEQAETLAAEDDRYATAAVTKQRVRVDNPAPITPAAAEKAADETLPLETRLCALLAASPQHADSLIAAVLEPAGEVTAALTMLELEGRVEQQPGKIFVLI